MTKAGPVFVAPAGIGRGLFAARSFRRGDIVLTIGGRVVNYERLW